MIAGFSFHYSSDSGASMRAHDPISRLRRLAFAAASLAILPAILVASLSAETVKRRPAVAPVVYSLAYVPVDQDLFTYFRGSLSVTRRSPADRRQSTNHNQKCATSISRLMRNRQPRTARLGSTPHRQPSRARLKSCPRPPEPPLHRKIRATPFLINRLTNSASASANRPVNYRLI